MGRHTERPVRPQRRRAGLAAAGQVGDGACLGALGVVSGLLLGANGRLIVGEDRLSRLLTLPAAPAAAPPVLDKDSGVQLAATAIGIHDGAFLPGSVPDR